MISTRSALSRHHNYAAREPSSLGNLDRLDMPATATAGPCGTEVRRPCFGQLNH
jgi:hypothetical protein